MKGKNLIAALFVLTLTASFAAAADTAYVNKLQKARQEKEVSLKSAHGPLSLIGSYELKEGDNRVGSNSASAVVLPANAAPALVGTISFHGGKATFTSSGAVPVLLNGKAVTGATELGGGPGSQQSLTIGRLQLEWHPSGQGMSVMVSDPQSPSIKNFGGLDWYPVDEQWRIQGKFVPYATPKSIQNQNALGGENNSQSTGEAVFTKNGREYRLEVESGPRGTTILFGDATNGKITYGGGRSIPMEKLGGDKVMLDFNQAENSPCAVSPYTACSLAAKRNRIDLEVAAGEKKPKIHVVRTASAPAEIR